MPRRQGWCWAQDTELVMARPSWRDTGFRLTMAKWSKCRGFHAETTHPAGPEVASWRKGLSQLG